MLGIAAGFAMPLPALAEAALTYAGPNVVLVRFGGGVRRDDRRRGHLSPYPATIWPRAIPSSRTLASINRKGVATSHAEGTPNLLTGRYLAYRNARKLESDRLKPLGPALFESLRRSFAIPSPEVLLVNGEDRPQEEFFIFGAGDHFGGRLPV